MTIILHIGDKFSKRLVDLMTTENINRRQLCLKIGVQRKSLYCWLKGVNYPQYDALIKLSDFFKVSVNFLLGISNDDYNLERCSIDDVQKLFCSKLIIFMKENSLTKYAFAKKIGIGQSTMERWFKCGGMPETAVLIRISKATGYSVDYLLGYK